MLQDSAEIKVKIKSIISQDNYIVNTLKFLPTYMYTKKDFTGTWSGIPLPKKVIMIYERPSEDTVNSMQQMLVFRVDILADNTKENEILEADKCLRQIQALLDEQEIVKGGILFSLGTVGTTTGSVGNAQYQLSQEFGMYSSVYTPKHE